MSIPTWGMLEKSQVDPETIEEAINRLIAAHDLLPDHKASEIIDHLAASIIADKIKEWEEVSLAGNFKRGDIHWLTAFESIDGYDKSVAGVSVDGYGVTLLTAAEIANTKFISKEFNFVFNLSWDKKRMLRVPIWLTSIESQEVRIACGSMDGAGGVDSDRHIGFKVLDDLLYGTVGNDVEETTLYLCPVALGATNLEWIFTPGVSVEFLVNGVSKGTITENLPSGTDKADIAVFASIRTTVAVAKQLMLRCWDLWQES